MQSDIKSILLKNGNEQFKDITELLTKIPSPPWRDYGNKNANNITYIPTADELEVVKAAIYLRRPILVTGKPGLGKSALAKAIVKALDLGELLHWQITTESTLKEALYSYDAIARLQDVQLSQKDKNISTEIENYLKLEALGSAFASKDKPRVLLIDELDKSDVDLPNNLLHIFEEGYFEIPELKRLKNKQEVTINTIDNNQVVIKNGKVECKHFPIVIMTSNGERDFPPAFKRRCLQIELHKPKKEELIKIVKTNLGIEIDKEDALLELFIEKRDEFDNNIATDQLLNAIYLRAKGIIDNSDFKSLKENSLLEKIFKPLVE